MASHRPLGLHKERLMRYRHRYRPPWVFNPNAWSGTRATKLVIATWQFLAVAWCSRNKQEKRNKYVEIWEIVAYRLLHQDDYARSIGYILWLECQHNRTVLARDVPLVLYVYGAIKLKVKIEHLLWGRAWDSSLTSRHGHTCEIQGNMLAGNKIMFMLESVK